MIEGETLVLPPEAAAAAKGYLRVERADEDGLIEALAASAAELCEAFTGRVLIVRSFVETLPASRAWRRLGRAPVRAIILIEALAEDGPAQIVESGGYGIELDAEGDGRVRLTDPGEARRIRVHYQAGLANDWAGLPAALRQGIVRLAAHGYANRTAEDPRASEPPAAVAALWRPFRRLRLR